MEQNLEERLESLPILRTYVEAEAHDWAEPALVRLEGRWILPILFVQEHAFEASAEGAVSRALEEIFCGLVDAESALLLMGIAHLTFAAAPLIRVSKGERQPQHKLEHKEG